MKRALKLIRVGGNIWLAKMETKDGTLFIVTIHASSLAEALEKAMQTEPDAA